MTHYHLRISNKNGDDKFHTDDYDNVPKILASYTSLSRVSNIIITAVSKCQRSKEYQDWESNGSTS